jgi:hypothetical protein
VQGHLPEATGEVRKRDGFAVGKSRPASTRREEEFAAVWHRLS